MELIGKRHGVDIALLPIGGHWHDGPRRCRLYGRADRPSGDPIHYDTFPRSRPMPRPLPRTSSRREWHNRPRARPDRLSNCSGSQSRAAQPGRLLYSTGAVWGARWHRAGVGEVAPPGWPDRSPPGSKAQYPVLPEVSVEPSLGTVAGPSFTISSGG